MVLRMALLALMIGLAACGEDADVAQLPPPQEPEPDAVGYFCGMAVAEHRGPKGQAFIDGDAKPLWFSSVRDTLAFTLLPGEPRTVVALYVNDMSGAEHWAEPQAGRWVLARDAVYVAGSRAVGGMGVQELVPFAVRSAADRFRSIHGGEIYRFDEVPEHFVLGADAGLAAAPSLPSGMKDPGHGGHARD